jgi:G3E family GTPase
MLNSFRETLADLYGRRTRGDVPAFARVLVETTGLADPAPILQCLLRDSFVAHYYRLAALITTVDAVFGERELNDHSECARQVALADRLIVTKTDLTGGACPPSLVSRLRAINPTAPLVDSSNAALPLQAVFPIAADAGRAERVERVSSAHSHDNDTIRSESFVLEQPVTWAGLAGWVDLTREFFGRGMLRCKGIVEVADSGRPYLIQGVQGVFASPLRLDIWPDDDHRSRLVCITRGIDAVHLRASLACLHALPGTYRPASIDDLIAQQRRQ